MFDKTPELFLLRSRDLKAFLFGFVLRDIQIHLTIVLFLKLQKFVVEDIEYNQLSEVPEGNVSDENSEGLNWYEYDISTHRVESLDQIYIVDDGSTIYKIQFLSYYNQEDESRHITFIASWLAGDSIAAINDPNLVKISPCIIVDDNLVWSLSESILIYENGYQICQFSCQLEVVVRFENVKVKGDKSIEIH